MNYGERQQRAQLLVDAFRSKPLQTYKDCDGIIWTFEQIAFEIESMTDFGTSLVATAGLVFHAINSTPDLF